MSDSDSRLVKLVTTDSDAHAMDFLFVRTEGGDEASIGDFAAAWNRRRSYEVNGIGAGGHAGANNLVKSAKVVGVGVDPDGLVWTAAEVMLFESLAGLGVNDGVSFGAVGTGAERITRGSRIVGVGRNDVRVVPERSASVRRRFIRSGDKMWKSHP